MYNVPYLQKNIFRHTISLSVSILHVQIDSTDSRCRHMRHRKARCNRVFHLYFRCICLELNIQACTLTGQIPQSFPYHLLCTVRKTMIFCTDLFIPATSLYRISPLPKGLYQSVCAKIWTLLHKRTAKTPKECFISVTF